MPKLLSNFTSYHRKNFLRIYIRYAIHIFLFHSFYPFCTILDIHHLLFELISIFLVLLDDLKKSFHHNKNHLPSYTCLYHGNDQAYTLLGTCLHLQIFHNHNHVLYFFKKFHRKTSLRKLLKFLFHLFYFISTHLHNIGLNFYHKRLLVRTFPP